MELFIYTPGFKLDESIDACFSMDYRMYGNEDDVFFVCTTNNTLELGCGDYLWREEDPDVDTWQTVQLQLTNFGR